MLTSALLLSIRLGVILLLLTPLVVTKTTLYPFVVGKALYWRTIVEIVFVLWALLAVSAPAYRPPRSWLLALLGVGLACSVLAAWFGVSFQRSVWSTYERMEGVIDVAHQFAFVLVAISVFRDCSSWRTLLTMNLVASAVVALLAICRYFEIDVPFYSTLSERDHPRIGGSLGNATYLGAYGAANGMVAVALLARALAARRERPHWAAVVFWLVAAVLNFYTLILSGSLGALLGLVSGAAVVTIGGVMMVRGRLRWAASAVVLVLASAAVAAAFSLTNDAAQSEQASEQQTDSLLLSRILLVGAGDTGSRSRLVAWQAGIEGFAARPLLGWGPENFIAVFGRYVTGFPKLEIHDRAHGKFIEEAVTKGLLGIVSYLALWLFVLLVMLRTIRADAVALPDRVFALFLGAALFSYFVQSQTLFDTMSLTLQLLLLVGYVGHLDIERRTGAQRAAARRRAASAWLGRLWSGNVLLQRGARAAVVIAALAVAASSVVASASIWSAAQATARAFQGAQPIPNLERALTFAPLANEVRLVFFNAVANAWPKVRIRQPAEARRLLKLADAEAAGAQATEPENWLIQHYLARFYREMAKTETSYQAVAQRHHRVAYQLAPNQHTYTAGLPIGEPLLPPDGP